MLRFGFDPGTDVFGFCCVFWYHCNLFLKKIKKRFMAVKGPRGALFYMGLRFRQFCVYYWKNK